MPDFMEALHDEDARARGAVTSAIGLVARYHKDDLQSFGPAAVSALNVAIRDEDLPMKVKLIQALREFGKLASESMPSLIEAINDAASRHDAAHTLSEIGHPARCVWSTPVALIGDPSARRSVIYALGRTGSIEHVLTVIMDALIDEQTREACRAGLR